MVVVMILVFAIPVMVAVTIAIPFVAMLKAAAIAFPVAVEIEPALVAWTNPAGAGIRSASPITFVPAVMSVRGIPIAANPNKVGARRGWWLNYHARRRRSANPDADTDLRACAIGAEQQYRGNQHKSHETFHISLISFRRAATVSGYSVSVTLRLPAISGWFLVLGTWQKRR